VRPLGQASGPLRCQAFGLPRQDGGGAFRTSGVVVDQEKGLAWLESTASGRSAAKARASRAGVGRRKDASGLSVSGHLQRPLRLSARLSRDFALFCRWSAWGDTVPHEFDMDTRIVSPGVASPTHPVARGCRTCAGGRRFRAVVMRAQSRLSVCRPGT